MVYLSGFGSSINNCIGGRVDNGIFSGISIDIWSCIGSCMLRHCKWYWNYIGSVIVSCIGSGSGSFIVSSFGSGFGSGICRGIGYGIENGIGSGKVSGIGI